MCSSDLEVPSTDTASLMHLSNLKSMSISVVWVIYAAFTMGVGLWLRARWLRLISLAVLLVTIAKVFLYDLSFLGTVHRIISFLFLGVLLILISWLYTRFRSVLTGSEETSEPAEPSASPEPPDPPQQP